MRTLSKASVALLILIFGTILYAASPQIEITKVSRLVGNDGIWGPGNIRSAFNTSSSETLVIWQGPLPQQEATGRNVTVLGKVFDSQGNVTPRVFPSFPKGACGVAGDGLGGGCSVAYNPSTLEYLVVYGRLTQAGVFSVRGMRLDSNLKVTAAEFEIIPATSALHMIDPYVIFNTQSGGYILTWRASAVAEGVPTSNAGLTAVQLDKVGKANGPKVIIRKDPGSPDGIHSGSPEELDLKMLPSGRFILLFRQFVADRVVDYWLASFNEALQGVNVSKIGSYPTSLSPPYERYGGTLSVLPNGSAVVFYATAGECDNFVCSSWRWFRRPIDSQGSLTGQASPAFSALLQKTNLLNPCVAYSTTSTGTSGILIAVQGGGTQQKPKATVWAQVLDSKGGPAGKPVALRDFGYYVYGPSVIASPRNLKDKSYQFNWLQVFVQYENEINGILNFKLDVKR